LTVQVRPNTLVLLTINPTRLMISMIAAPRFPESANLLPASMLKATLDTVAVQLTTNTLVTSPSPPSFTMKAVVIIFAVTLPKLAHSNPLAPIPSFDDVTPVQMAANALVLTVECATRTVVVVAFPQMPVGAYMAPTLVLIFAQDFLPVSVYADALVRSPKPFASGLVVVASMALPEATCHNPP